MERNTDQNLFLMPSKSYRGRYSQRLYLKPSEYKFTKSTCLKNSAKFLLMQSQYSHSRPSASLLFAHRLFSFSNLCFLSCSRVETTVDMDSPTTASCSFGNRLLECVITRWLLGKVFNWVNSLPISFLYLSILASILLGVMLVNSPLTARCHIIG